MPVKTQAMEPPRTLSRRMRSATLTATVLLAAGLAARPAGAIETNRAAAMVATQLLLMPSCQAGTCEDTNRLCKRCAHPASATAEPTATDALAILRVAVGQSSCVKCVCDVDDSGTVTATDALVTLKRAVGQAVTIACPAG